MSSNFSERLMKCFSSDDRFDYMNHINTWIANASHIFKKNYVIELDNTYDYYDFITGVKIDSGLYIIKDFNVLDSITNWNNFDKLDKLPISGYYYMYDRSRKDAENKAMEYRNSIKSSTNKAFILELYKASNKESIELVFTLDENIKLLSKLINDFKSSEKFTKSLLSFQKVIKELKNSDWDENLGYILFGYLYKNYGGTLNASVKDKERYYNDLRPYYSLSTFYKYDFNEIIELIDSL